MTDIPDHTTRIQEDLQSLQDAVDKLPASVDHIKIPDDIQTSDQLMVRDVLLTDRQKELQAWFEMYHHVGVHRYIYLIAKAEQGDARDDKSKNKTPASRKPRQPPSS